MMKWRLATLLGEYQDLSGKRLSYRALASAVGLSKTTVAAIANNEVQRADLKTMEAILSFMSDSLERPLTTDDLLHYEAD